MNPELLAEIHVQDTYFMIDPTPILGLWIFVVGGAVGSFLNVVIYRMPVGLSISHPGSRCPKCLHAIRWYHNVPILGWLILRGKCYDCKTPIAARYPLVEALVATLFLALAWTDALPYLGKPAGLTDPYPVAEHVRWLQMFYHAVLTAGLVAVAFIDFDRQRVPWKLFGTVLLVGIVLPCVWPSIRAIHYLPFAQRPPAWRWEPGFSVGFVDGLLGVVCAAALAWPATRAPWLTELNRRNAILALLLVGAFLGWQGVSVLACVTATAYLVGGAVAFHEAFEGRATEGRVPWTGILTVCTVAWLLTWRMIVQWLPVLR